MLIKADATEKKREEIAKEQAESAEHTAAIRRSAAKEDAVQRQEQELQKHALRPDLRTFKLVQKPRELSFIGSSDVEEAASPGLISSGFL